MVQAKSKTKLSTRAGSKPPKGVVYRAPCQGGEPGPLEDSAFGFALGCLVRLMYKSMYTGARFAAPFQIISCFYSEL